MKYTEKDLQRFWSRVDRSGGESSCWEWLMGKFHNGYGAIRWYGKQVRANRLAYEITHNINLGDRVLYHTCRNPGCCNPSHMVIKETDAVKRFWNKVDQSRGINSCWNWMDATGNGYGVHRWNGKVHLSHRIAYLLTYGDPGKFHVCHSCDNPTCCNPRHLWLGTDSDNVMDAFKKGRLSKGESHTVTKLSDRQVSAIRYLYAQGGVSYRSIAQDFGVSGSQVHKIVRHISRK